MPGQPADVAMSALELAQAGRFAEIRDAATLDKPMLILHGARDYQVTVEDDLARWQAELDGREEVTIRVYPDLNHLFAAGSGPSSPAEYEPAQHVEPTVVDDIATWITARD